jgi:hypothetical protein
MPAAILHLPRLQDPTSAIVAGLLLMAFVTFVALAINALIRRSRESRSGEESLITPELASTTELWRPPPADASQNSVVNEGITDVLGGAATDDLDLGDGPGGLPAL